jgi:phage terminase large subunit-like protein
MSILKTKYPRFLNRALFNNVKHTVIHAGRQTGKTYNTAQWLIEETMDLGCTSLWVDTVHPNIDKYIERYFMKILHPIWKECKWNQQRKILTLPRGAIEFGSAQKPENLEGFNYPRYVLNEAGIILKKSSLWDNTLYPMLKGDNVRGKIIGTPKGRNKFHELAALGRSGNPDYATYHFTVYDSPYWTNEQISVARNLSPELVFKQEYMAEFIEGEGMVFRKIREIIKEIKSEVIPNRRYLIGIDLAKHVDFTVIVVMDDVTHEVVYMDRFNQIDWVLQKARIRSVWEKWNRGQVVVDSTGAGDSVFDDLVAMGITVKPFRFTSSSKAEIINNLSVAIEHRELFIPNDPVIIDELEMYEYSITKAGNVTYSAPEGFHDDIVMALCLVWSLAKNVQQVQIIPAWQLGV